MTTVSGGHDGPDPVVRFLLGRHRAVSLRAIVFAVALFLVAAVFQYATMAAAEELRQFGGITQTLPWEALGMTLSHPGLVVGLAAIHAYLNEGCLPAVLLAAAPVLGMRTWTYYGPFGGPYVLVFEPIAGVLHSVPRVALYATPGIAIGFAARWLRIEYLDLPEPT